MKKVNGFQKFCKTAYRQRWLYVFALPAIVFYFIFAYLPMFGLVMAFQDFDIIRGFGGSESVGLDNFKLLFQMKEFTSALGNTFAIAFLKLVIGFPLTIVFALMLNDLQSNRIRKTVQTISYMPYFISWVIAAGIWYKFLSPDGGVVNEILINLGLVKESIYFFGSRKYFYPIIILSEQWKNLGFGAIIYLAALAGVDPALYEAASVDGAGRFRRIWHISLPGIRSVIVLMLIMKTASLVSAGFDHLWTFGNINVRDVGDILDTFVLRTLKSSGLTGMSIGAAAGLFQSAVGLVLFLLANGIARLLKEDSVI